MGIYPSEIPVVRSGLNIFNLRIFGTEFSVRGTELFLRKRQRTRLANINNYYDTNMHGWKDNNSPGLKLYIHISSDIASVAPSAFTHKNEIRTFYTL